MKTVCVNTGSAYRVIIGNGLLADCGKWLGQVYPKGRVAIISDSHVMPLYGQVLSEALTNAGYEVYRFAFPAGECSKNGATYLDILHFLSQIPLTRSDTVIALGGGVVGDITGFAAATYLRGISYVQIPTTLLSMVDSSVGGKTAIDLPAGKNLAGAFYQPKLVLCDLDTLGTLPEDTFRDGCAEVIKYGILYDRALFSHLAEKAMDFDREYVIFQCVAHKARVVSADEFDRGGRQFLNLGHTVGHGIEAQSGYKVSHGKAVAIGMAVIAKAAWKSGICREDTYRAIEHILQTFQLPTQTAYTASQLYAAALSDKKRSADQVSLILPKEIGCCALSPTPIENLEHLIEAGL